MTEVKTFGGGGGGGEDGGAGSGGGASGGSSDSETWKFFVAVRVRPASKSERASNRHRSIVRVIDDHVLVFDPKSDSGGSAGDGADDDDQENSDFNSAAAAAGGRRPKTPMASLASALAAGGLGHHRPREQQFAFDRVFSSRASQRDVYAHTAQRLLDSVLNGYNASCFAYGATGAGKTFTMIGGKNDPGVMVHTMHELFARIGAANGGGSGGGGASAPSSPRAGAGARSIGGGASSHPAPTYRIAMMYLEVYCEQLRDLLSVRKDPLPLRETADGGMVVTGLSTHHPKSAAAVFELLAVGNANRSQSPTDRNAESSRSHAVLQITIQSRDSRAHVSYDGNGDSAAGAGAGAGAGGESSERAPGELRFGKLSLIDLAGSERAAVSKNRGAVQLEGANINRSLLALGNCINALANSANPQFVPYRDSKLTRLLKDSLGGNCRTGMEGQRVRLRCRRPAFLLLIALLLPRPDGVQ
jgi:kinesin family member 18/19